MSRVPPNRTTTTAGTPGRPQTGSLRPAASASNMRSTAAAAAASPSSPSKPRVRSQLTAASSPARPARGRAAGDSPSSPSKGDVDEKKKPAGASSISLREAIAQKRAEARKLQKAAQQAQLGLDDMTSMQDAVPSFDKPADEPIEVGRWSLLEAIERARRSGNINLSTRSLTCIPSALFKIHLGITPAPLQSAAEEPRSSSTSHQSSSYYDTHDLEVLKAWSNDIAEIQPEISMFGSLKILDLHSNKIRSLPDSFADLTALKVLDLSHNLLTSLPTNLFALPNLINLNISHNELTSLPFNAPFEGGTQPSARPAPRSASSSAGGGVSVGLGADSFFEPSIFRASTPLPSLHILDASHNRITADAFDAENAPKSIRSIDLSHNPLNNSSSSGDGRWAIDDDFDDPTYTAKKSMGSGASALMLNRLGALRALQVLHLAHAEIDDGAFAFSVSSSGGLDAGVVSSSSSSVFFPALRLLDLEETKVTEPAVRTAFQPFGREINTKNLTPDRLGALATLGSGNVGVGGLRDAVSPGVGLEEGSDDSNSSIIHAVIGKKIVREAWEIEAEQRRRGGGRVRQTMPSSSSPSPLRVADDDNNNAQDEWEIPFGPSSASSTPRRKQQPAVPIPATTATMTRRPTATAVEKEPWEIEAEQGLLTEGGRRRARAAAAAAKEKEEEEERKKKAKERRQQQQGADVEQITGTSTSRGSRTSPTAASTATSASVLSSLASPQYYSKNTETLSLPASVPVRGVQGHHRGFSYAASSPSSSSLSSAAVDAGDLSVPVPTLPLSVIATQPFAATLRVLELRNRRRDVSFDLPQALPDGLEQVTLPYLEELSLEGCSLGDAVPVSRTHVHQHDTVSSSSSGNGASSSHSGGGRTNEALLPLLTTLFPSLRSLDLSYNLLTSASLTAPVLRGLILASPKNEDGDENGDDNTNNPNHASSSPIRECDGTHDDNDNSSNNNSNNNNNDPTRRLGLRHLRLRGNRIENLDELETLALDLFRGNRREPRWRLEELDVRENSVGKLPPGLGMMPLDVFLVEGNSFRVPQRKVWEREGTKGLLSWLRGRMD